MTVAADTVTLNTVLEGLLFMVLSIMMKEKLIKTYPERDKR